MPEENINLSENSSATVSQGTPEKVAPAPGMLTEGTLVSIKKTVLKGKVIGYDLSDDKKTFQYFVEYEEEGELQKRAFLLNQIEEITE
jgi:hypothetical protein